VWRRWSVSSIWSIPSIRSIWSVPSGRGAGSSGLRGPSTKGFDLWGTFLRATHRQVLAPSLGRPQLSFGQEGFPRSKSCKIEAPPTCLRRGGRVGQASRSEKRRHPAITYNPTVARGGESPALCLPSREDRPVASRWSSAKRTPCRSAMVRMSRRVRPGAKALSPGGIPIPRSAGIGDNPRERVSTDGKPLPGSVQSTCLFRMRQTHALGGVGRLDPNWPETRERISK
jgi:hypothetical protein